MLLESREEVKEKEVMKVVFFFALGNNIQHKQITEYYISKIVFVCRIFFFYGIKYPHNDNTVYKDIYWFSHTPPATDLNSSIRLRI